MKIYPSTATINQSYKGSQKIFNASSPVRNEISDMVNISDEGKFLQAQTSAQKGSKNDLMSLDNFMDGAGRDGVITLDEIKTFYQKNLKKSEAILKDTLQSLGLPANASITMQSDSEGKIVVSSDMSAADNEKLEQALNKNHEFKSAFSAAASNRSFIEAIEEHLEFAKAYAKDPKAAVARYGIGNKSKEYDFLFQYTEGVAGFVKMA